MGSTTCGRELTGAVSYSATEEEKKPQLGSRCLPSSWTGGPGTAKLQVDAEIVMEAIVSTYVCKIISIAALEIWRIEGPSRHVLATAKFTSKMTYQVCSDMTVPVVIDNDEVFSNIR